MDINLSFKKHKTVEKEGYVVNHTSPVSPHVSRQDWPFIAASNRQRRKAYLLDRKSHAYSQQPSTRNSYYRPPLTNITNGSNMSVDLEINTPPNSTFLSTLTPLPELPDGSTSTLSPNLGNKTNFYITSNLGSSSGKRPSSSVINGSPINTSSNHKRITTTNQSNTNTLFQSSPVVDCSPTSSNIGSTSGKRPSSSVVNGSPINTSSTRKRITTTNWAYANTLFQSSSVLNCTPTSSNIGPSSKYDSITSTSNNKNSKGKDNVHPQIVQPNIHSPVSVSNAKQKPRDMYADIPVFDLDMSDDTLTQAVRRGHGISKEYIDHGDPIHVCFGCGAMLWEVEMLRGNHDRKKQSFSLCCKNGNVELPKPVLPPPLLMKLYKGHHPRSVNFMNNIRAYNMMFSFTSMGGKVDKTLQNGRGPFVFRLQGQNFHRMGSLLPANGDLPKFSQLYIYDSENEVAHRANAVSSGSKTKYRNQKDLDHETITTLKNMLDSCNPLVKSFRMVRDCLKDNDWKNVGLKLIANREKDGRTYNLPTAPEVAGLIVGDVDQLLDKRDIIVRTTSGYLQRISELHPLYLALQYPLLFPYAEDGFRLGIKHKGIPNDCQVVRTRLTMREFFCYRIQDRIHHFSLLVHAKKLFHQFLVDAYTMVESDRLSYIKTQQKQLRTDTFQNLNENIQKGSTNASETGKRILLPSSFTGGSRYMMQKYLDAMAICKTVGYPDLFITITCNPNWPEVHRCLADKKLQPEDRPDILTRLFKIKLDHLIHEFKKDQIFGPLQAVIYTVEFQKRGLPHAHICLFLAAGHKFPTAQDVDRIICAEIPDKRHDPELYELVKQFMVHGPCGTANPNCPCMVQNKCSKKFPKKFQDETSVDQDGYPVYRRRNTGNIIEKNGIPLDNRHVVPYNPSLLKKYQCHMNVEWCNQSGSIKYLFKYINKGPDRVTASLYHLNQQLNEKTTPKNKDEVQNYLDCRYVSACEASWRIFGYDIHYRWPPVEVLPFHDKDKQSIVYEDSADLCDVVTNPTVKNSMFTQWMALNKVDDFARTLKYVDFPRYYVWIRKDRKWVRRRIAGGNIGRIHYVPPSLGDVYYLRILLNHVRGPTCFDDIKTVNGKVFTTYKEACQELGLLNDDKEYVDAIQEASTWATGSFLRNFFVTLLISNSVTRPYDLWLKTWEFLSEDIQHRQRQILNVPGLVLQETELKNLCLSNIEELLRLNGSTLKNFVDMPSPDKEYVSTLNNRLIRNELLYDKDSLVTEHADLLCKLTEEQHHLYQTVITSVYKDEGGVFFVYGYGGTGKTFVWKTLTAALRSKGEIVLNVASSGIASLLLSGGRTAHSRFIIPINICETSICSIDSNSELAALIKKTRLIIWDEAPMIHKHCFEALDRTMRDILRSINPNSQNKPFGGKVVVFGGDFRQILPVIPKGTRSNIVQASLNSSYLWDYCQVLKLTINMRLKVGCVQEDVEEIKEFGNWILDVGDGLVGGPNDGEVDIQIPYDLLIHDTVDPVNALISFTYPDMVNRLFDPLYFQQRAILAPTHIVVNAINEKLLQTIPGDETIYLSSDSLCESAEISEIDNAIFSTEVINSLQLSGLPNHKLVLKVGVPVMLLRNVDQSNGLCNGTRLQVIKLGKHVIEAKVITGSNIGHHTLISRLKMTPSDKNIPVRICRKQFPIAVCFAMTINKSQGQSLDRVGLYLPRPVFSHGQLYVALSRVKSKKGLKILIFDQDSTITNTTTNVVYKEVLQCL